MSDDLSLVRDFIASQPDSPEQDAAWTALNNLAAALREALADANDESTRAEQHNYRAERAEAERDRADALLRECRPILGADVLTNRDVAARIDAHLRGEGAGRCEHGAPWIGADCQQCTQRGEGAGR